MAANVGGGGHGADVAQVAAEVVAVDAGAADDARDAMRRGRVRSRQLVELDDLEARWVNATDEEKTRLFNIRRSNHRHSIHTELGRRWFRDNPGGEWEDFETAYAAAIRTATRRAFYAHYSGGAIDVAADDGRAESGGGVLRGCPNDCKVECKGECQAREGSSGDEGEHISCEEQFGQARERYYRGAFHPHTEERKAYYLSDNAIDRDCYYCGRRLERNENNRLGRRSRRRALTSPPIELRCDGCREAPEVPQASPVYNCAAPGCGIRLSKTWYELISPSQAAKPRNTRRCRVCAGGGLAREEAVRMSAARCAALEREARGEEADSASEESGDESDEKDDGL